MTPVILRDVLYPSRGRGVPGRGGAGFSARPDERGWAGPLPEGKVFLMYRQCLSAVFAHKKTASPPLRAASPTTQTTATTPRTRRREMTSETRIGGDAGNEPLPGERAALEPRGRGMGS